ncbi:hypothetical protein INT45_009856 [Circinella minor]|uniref:Uncharacterized protein n=1 Tax=Circinella minor TaxID=1195481 RepID=A0A8H7VJX5_9FUNG|nr:hypothetical protein INT45_009856 [Circinella minor]
MMDSSKKWKIEEGVVVEDKIYEFVKTCNYEHAAHSFILDLGDPCWKSGFTPSQLKQIEEENVVPLEKLPTCLKEFFKKFKKVVCIYFCYDYIT